MIRTAFNANEINENDSHNHVDKMTNKSSHCAPLSDNNDKCFRVDIFEETIQRIVFLIDRLNNIDVFSLNNFHSFKYYCKILRITCPISLFEQNLQWNRQNHSHAKKKNKQIDEFNGQRWFARNGWYFLAFNKWMKQTTWLAICEYQVAAYSIYLRF